MELKTCPSCGFQNHPDMEKCQKCSASMTGIFSFISSQGVTPSGITSPSAPSRRRTAGMPSQPRSGARAVLSLVIFFLFLGMGLVQFFVQKKSPRYSKTTSKVPSTSIAPGLYLKSYELGIGQKIDKIDYKTTTVAPDYTGYLVFKFYLSKAVPINQIVKFSFRKADSDTPLMTYNYVNKASGSSFYFGYDRGNRVLTQGVYLCEIFSPENLLIGSISVVVKEN